MDFTQVIIADFLLLVRDIVILTTNILIISPETAIYNSATSTLVKIAFVKSCTLRVVTNLETEEMQNVFSVS